jgi:hypothetical protein
MTKKKITGIRKVKRVSKRTIPSAKKEQSSDLKMGLFTKANGKEMLDMATEFKNGQMVPSMRDIGRITKLTAKVYSGMSMVTNMRDGGSETKPMATVNTLTAMEPHTKEIGKMIFSMAKV